MMRLSMTASLWVCLLDVNPLKIIPTVRHEHSTRVAGYEHCERNEQRVLSERALRQRITRSCSDASMPLRLRLQLGRNHTSVVAIFSCTMFAGASSTLPHHLTRSMLAFSACCCCRLGLQSTAQSHSHSSSFPVSPRLEQATTPKQQATYPL